MSAEIKISFLKDLENALSDKVTATNLTTILSVSSDILEHYEFSRILRTEDACSMDLFEAYLSAIQIEGRSANTVAHYRYVINRLLQELNTPIRNITVYHLRSWLSKEKARGVSDRTLEGNRQTFSSFFGWLWREGLIEKNPVANLGAIKTPKKVVEVCTDVDIDKLKYACGDLRDMAIISFLLATGCRISEATALNRDDIDFTNKEVLVLGKGNKERTVYFNDVTALHLKKYLKSRRDDDPCLFLGKRGRLKPGGVRVMLNRVAANADVSHIHPHKFRRTLATMLIAHGMAIQEVASILGHESLNTTMKYISLDKSQVKNSYRKYA